MEQGYKINSLKYSDLGTTSFLFHYVQNTLFKSVKFIQIEYF